VADFPIDLDEGLADRLLRSFDLDGKIPRALEALGPLSDRDVVVVDAGRGIRARQLAALGARLTVLERADRIDRLAAALAAIDELRGRPALAGEPGALGLPSASADAIVAMWTAYRPPNQDEVSEAERVLRPGGRLLVVHDYGRDDVSRLRGDMPEYGSWSRRDGWYLTNGFRMRVIHTFWTFPSVDDTRQFLVDGFGQLGAAVAESLKRARLSYNVAIYHRTRVERRESEAIATASAS
jgi:SAM-dependent methyltransferase